MVKIGHYHLAQCLLNLTNLHQTVCHLANSDIQSFHVAKNSEKNWQLKLSDFRPGKSCELFCKVRKSQETQAFHLPSDMFTAHGY